jgi:Domain of unknown function (DUF4349)
MRKLSVSIFAFLALAALVGFVATGGLSAGSANNGAGGGGGVPVAGATRAATDAVGFAPEGARGAVQPGVGASVSSGGGEAEASGPVGALGALPVIGPAVVKTASLEVQVPKGDFDKAFETAMQVAARYGGYVQSSSTSGTKIHSGTLTIRVPSASFQNAMSDLSGVGTVQSRSVSGQDVTNEYVDLNARLRTWEAQEAVLLRLMKRATSVEATLRVQTNLQDVQFRIEQIKGQLRVLENQTDLATIDLSLHEPGAVVRPVPRAAPDERPSLAEAWTKAVNGFLGVLYATVVGLGYLVPIALICLAVWFAIRRVRPVPPTSAPSPGA